MPLYGTQVINGVLDQILTKEGLLPEGWAYTAGNQITPATVHMALDLGIEVPSNPLAGGKVLLKSLTVTGIDRFTSFQVLDFSKGLPVGLTNCRTCDH